MTIVVDTDVVAAALLGEPETAADATRLLLAGRPLAAPGHWMAELCNVVWKAVRLGRLDIGAVDDVLSTAEALPVESVEIATLWRGAVARAVALGHPAYDMLFVELAERRSGQVASFDRTLRRRVPDRVRSPAEILAARRS